MAENGWEQAREWSINANSPAPTLVGGSGKHGGPDLGPTRAKKAWLDLGVDGKSISDLPPSKEFRGLPKLTIKMCARLQGFPDTWFFSGKKTSRYRQVGNALPPQMALYIGKELKRVLTKKRIWAVS
jgi:DNA (cytosine-5)-methyltransferase 1